MLSNESGAPTPEQVVNQATTSPPPGVYLLNTFNEYNPSVVGYLLFERPYGQRLELIEQYPEWTLAKLYRYLIVTYPEETDTNDLLTSFDNDPYIESASDINNIKGVTSSSYENSSLNKTENNNVLRGFIGDFISDLDVSLAWNLSEGMGYIGIIDSGTDVDHDALRPFSDSNQYLGGNLLEDHYQLDLASGDLNVDEAEPIDTQGDILLEDCDLADGVDDNLASSIFVGHGTHVSGIIAAKNSNVDGICKNCGLGVLKWIRFSTCLDLFNPPTLGIENMVSVIPQIFVELSSSGGYGTANWSGGLQEYTNGFTHIINDEFYCDDVKHQPFCEALELFRENNVLMVSAGGNNRVKIQFPASETETVAVGGLDQNGVFWNESPGPNGVYDFSDDSNCPLNGPVNQCGSNISNPPIDQKVDVTTQAKSVYSTFYPEGRWNEELGCSDNNDGVDDGYGYCTGTSMSSPQVAAILQLMRSTNPLLPNGTYDPSKTIGLINVLNSTSSQYLVDQNVNNYLGYGLPSASLAIAKILGYSDGELMKTRLTPMFEVISDNPKNNVYSPFPQLPFAFLVGNGSTYTSNVNAELVSEFPSYWYGPNLSLPIPRANFYVFTTNNNPSVNLKNMVPLRRMEKTINGNNRNDTYAVNDTEIKDYHDEGYNYAGIEGYIYPICSSEPFCIPDGAHKLYRTEDSVNFNHKLINLPVTDPAPPNSVKLGYVYPNVDSDGDGLIDGQELILGTSLTDTDTDGDGLSDGFEYPPAGVPLSDPLISDIIFEDGFE